MTDLPKVSCLMATHGRYADVCRAVLDFARQDYPNAELIILNNHPSPLSCDLPDVKIINEPGHETLGACRLRLLELSAGADYIRTWDDDDVYLPWTISQGVAHIGDHVAFKPSHSWFNPEGGGFRLEDNVFEAAMLTRRDFAEAHPYQCTAGDEHLTLVEAIHNSPTGLKRRDVGVWSSYVYRWGWGVHHISGTMGQGTTEKRTRGWMEANQDTGKDYGGELSLHRAVGERRDLLAGMAPYTGEYRHEFYSRCFGEDPPHSGLPKQVGPGFIHGVAIQDLLPGQKLCAMEFGRDAEGSTFDLLEIPRIELLISVDPDMKTFEDVKEELGIDDLPRIHMIGDLGDCAGCSLKSQPNYLTLNAGSAMKNLNALLTVRNSLAPLAVISCLASDAFLVRTILEPTHTTRRIGPYFVFLPRVLPAWLHWSNIIIEARKPLEV